MLGVSADAEQVSRRVWASSRVRRVFARRSGFTDPGEELVMRRVAADARAQPILDIGVGAGRTVPYLRSLSDAYVAVDYLAEMVALTRARFPDARVEQADARELSGFAGGSFALACFSFNGIDGIAHEQRSHVYAAVLRVLRPGGVFLFSTHNLDHRCAGRPPWSRCRFAVRDGLRPLAGNVARLPRSIASYLGLRRMAVRGEGWATLVDPAYGFSVLWHYVTLEEIGRELRAAGFSADVEVYSTRAQRVSSGGETRESPWLHVLARKPVAD
jgi:SAM-dependent methyltransferase